MTGGINNLKPFLSEMVAKSDPKQYHKKMRIRAEDTSNPKSSRPVHATENATPEHASSYVLTAYIEPLNLDEWEIQPLPNRTLAQKRLLTKITYPGLNSCRKLPEQWPVDNSPTDADPFLPWIHDVFPATDGKFIQFVAQNKRRCRTGPAEMDRMRQMQAQLALFQNAPVQRFVDQHNNITRYRLSTSYEQADPDSYTTRFICRFQPSRLETLSVFNFDYDWASYRKRYRGFVKNQMDGSIHQVHTSQLIFRCPVPLRLQADVVANNSNNSIKNDDWTNLFVDLIPIRTPPRYGMPHQFLQPKYQEFEAEERFNASAVYGPNHVLPLRQDSGRWENIPICPPTSYDQIYPSSILSKAATTTSHNHNTIKKNKKKHRLVSCLWTSAGYATRGNRHSIQDGARRLLEWITYHILVGFDHFYVYDNSLAHQNNTKNNATTAAPTTLKSITDLFPEHLVTYINWPAQVCNNNLAKDDCPGERSSQYAAESSCRLRFGPHTDWMGQFDMDEYLVPSSLGLNKNMGSVTDLLDQLDREDTRVLSFQSQRALVRREFIEHNIRPFKNKTICNSPAPCFYLNIPDKITLLQAYNCDADLPGQKHDPDPAEKQLYRPDYVLQHFVHYAAVTTLLDKNRTEFEKEGFKWKRRGVDPRHRFANETTEAFMLHAKSVAVHETSAYHRRCHVDNLLLPPRKRGECYLGLPWPVVPAQNRTTNEAGLLYNCHLHPGIEHELVPRLTRALAQMKLKQENSVARKATK